MRLILRANDSSRRTKVESTAVNVNDGSCRRRRAVGSGGRVRNKGEVETCSEEKRGLI